MPGRPYCMVHDQRSSYRPRTMERSARLVAHGVLTPRMVVGLLIGLPLALIVIYGFWLAGELGLAPAWTPESGEPSHPGRERRTGRRGPPGSEPSVGFG